MDKAEWFVLKDFKILNKWLLLIALSMVLCSCSGESETADSGVARHSASAKWPPVEDSIAPDKYGYLTDREVAGLRYQSGNHYGITDSSGRFGYVDGEKIQFYVGDIAVGAKIEPAPKLTPIELANGRAWLAVHIAQFLHSLDDDGLLLNGITISEATHIAAQGKHTNFLNKDWLKQYPASYREIDLLVFELTSATSKGAGYRISKEEATSTMVSTLDAKISHYYTDIKTQAENTMCEFSWDCKVIYLESVSDTPCSFPGKRFTYSTLDIDLPLFQQTVDEANDILKVRWSIHAIIRKDDDDFHNLCFYKTPPGPVCNEEKRCEFWD